MKGNTATVRPVTRQALAGVVLLAVMLRIPSLISPANITFDEGVYAASVRAMRSGAKPFVDIFSSQGPLFLPLLRIADVVGLERSQAPRLAMMAAAVALTVAVFLLARGYAGPTLAAGCAGLVAVSGTVLYATAPMQSDGIAMACGVLAILAAVRAPGAWSPWPAGVLLGCGVAVKSLHVVPCIIVVGAVLLSRRRWLATLAALGTGAVVVLATSAPWGFDRVWDQYVVFHLSVPATSAAPDRIGFVVGRLIRYDGALLLAVTAAFVGAAAGRSSPAPARAEWPRWLPAAWLGATVVVLVAGATLEPGYTRAVGFLIPPLALVLAQLRPSARLVLALIALAVPFQLITNPMATIRQPDGLDRQVIEVLTRLPAGALIVGDEPGLVWQAHRDLPPGLTDPSRARISAGYLTADDVAAALRRTDVCAYLDWSDRFRGFASAVSGEVAGWVVARNDGQGGRLLLRPRCTVPTTSGDS
jgi:hypothetical protein